MWSFKAWRRRRTLEHNPIDPAQWAEVRRHLPILDGLDEEEEQLLRERAVLFLHDKHLTTLSGLALGPVERLLLAVQAQLPLLHLGELEWYRGFHEIVLYPDDFLSPQRHRDASGIEHEWDDARSGEAWQQGPVILAWPGVVASGGWEGYNLVIHELAHKLDMLNGDANGLPPLHVAVQYGLSWPTATRASRYVDLMLLLLREKDLDINAVSTVHNLRDHWSGMHVLHLCCSGASDREKYAKVMVESLLKVPDIDVNKTTPNGGNTPLLMAVRSKRYGVARILAEDERVQVHVQNVRTKDVYDYCCLALSTAVDLTLYAMDNPFATSEYQEVRRALAPLVRVLCVRLRELRMSLMHVEMHKNVKYYSRKIFMEQIFWHKLHHCVHQIDKAGPKCAKFASARRRDTILSMLCVCVRSRMAPFAGRSTRSTARRAPALAHLPVELWLNIASFLPESSFFSRRYVLIFVIFIS